MENRITHREAEAIAPTDTSLQALEKSAPVTLSTEATEINKSKLKAIFSIDGYALPESLHSRYRVREGKFHDHATDILRFEDKGKSLATIVEDKIVIRDMLAVAVSKNWQAIEVKGTDNFKQQVWFEARVTGLDVKGYEPNQHDLDELAKRLPGNQIGAAEKQSEPTEDYSWMSQDQISIAVANKLLKRALANHSEKARAHIMRQFMREVTSGNMKLPVPKTVDRPGSMQRKNEGVLLEHGRAPYENNQKNKSSYYVKLDTEQGEKIVWGVDLKRAINKADVSIGDRISLERLGVMPVNVNEKVRDESGNVSKVFDVATHRNQWKVERALPEHGKEQEKSMEMER